MTNDELTKAFNEAGLDTPEKLAAFLKPASISAQLADYDGQIASIRDKRRSVNEELDTEETRVTAEREEVRKKLQAEN